jgi:AAA family ATP:ADP antiporter
VRIESVRRLEERMRNVPAWLSRLVDVRRGEVRTLVAAFVTLLLLITAHTALETARDALLLARFPARSLGVVYLAVAACVLPASWVAARVSERMGARRALGGGLALAGAAMVALFVVPTTRTSVVVLYVTSSLVGAVLVPLFWNLVGSILTVAEGRRLLGPLGAAGVLGGLVGSGAAAGLVEWLPAKALLLVSAGVLLLTMAALAWVPPHDDGASPQPAPIVGATGSSEAMRDEPFLRRVALLVVVSTAALVALDYFFKWTVARQIPHADVARFVARFYLVLNALSVVVQLLFSGAVLRRAGAAAAIAMTPLVLLLGGVGTLVSGGALAAVLVLRAVDGMLVNSVHRMAMELVYLPVPASARARAKPFIDGALARTTQASVGALTLVAGSAAWLSSWRLAAAVVVLVVVWSAVAVTTWRPYLGLLRRAIAKGAPARSGDLDPIDLENAEALTEYLAHDDPRVVGGAMSALARRGRERLISALVLLHDDESVLRYALELFAASRRNDWVSRARRLLTDRREGIRMAAARALAQHRQLAGKDLSGDPSPRVRGYSALLLGLGSETQDVSEDERVRELLGLPGPAGEEARVGILLGVADAPLEPRLLPLLASLAADLGSSGESTSALAKAASTQQATELVPALVERLALHDGREVLRSALVSLGRTAFDRVRAALHDPSQSRRLRIQLPGTIAPFGTADAAELLLTTIETEKDGLVRYKAIRGLGRMVADGSVKVERARAERLALANLVEHFRLLGLRAPFDPSPLHVPTGVSERPATERLLIGLLDDKLRQSLERTFRLLKIAHPREDIHTVNTAALSSDKRARANAAEFLDTLLRRRAQRTLRELLRIVTDDLSSPERVARAASICGTTPPGTREQAMTRLLRDADAIVVALAELHAAAVAGRPMEVVITGRSSDRPPVALATARRLAGGLAAPEGSHA